VDRAEGAARPDGWGLLGLVVMLACIGSLLPLPSALFEIDLARDVTEGFAILGGQDPPRLGPEIGGRFHLAPWWFYLVAAVLTVVPSLTAYTVVLGALASLKFVLAAWVGVQLGGVRLASALVAAVALPGVTAYQFFGVTHTNFVELFLWLSLAALLALGRGRPDAQVAPSPPRRWRGPWAALSALAFCMALHAHPTAVAALPAWLALFVVTSGGLRAAIPLLPWAAVGGALPLLPVLPELVAAATQVFDPSVQRPYARPVGDDLSSVFTLLRGVLWTEPETMAGTAFAAGERPPALWRGAWLVLVGGGLVAAAWTGLVGVGRERTIVRWALLGGFVAAVIVAQLVRVTPFYAAYVLSVPLALMLAAGWHHVGRHMPNGDRVAVGLVIGTLTLQWVTALSLGRALEGGWVPLRVPDSGSVKSAKRTARESLYVTVSDRDRFARHFCAGGSARPSINGPFATALDASQGHELQLAGGPACRAALRFGPNLLSAATAPTFPLPERLISRLLGVGSAAASPIIGEGWRQLELRRVLSPAGPVPLSESRTYPPRLRDWERGRERVHTFDLVLSPGDVLLVSPISSLHSGWAADLSLGERRLPPQTDMPILMAWRCLDCTEAQPVRLTVRGLAPEFVNVVTVGSTTAGL
jgi:hypothetical protein